MAGRKVSHEACSRTCSPGCGGGDDRVCVGGRSSPRQSDTGQCRDITQSQERNPHICRHFSQMSDSGHHRDGERGRHLNLRQNDLLKINPAGRRRQHMRRDPVRAVSPRPDRQRQSHNDINQLNRGHQLVRQLEIRQRLQFHSQTSDENGLSAWPAVSVLLHLDIHSSNADTRDQLQNNRGFRRSERHPLAASFSVVSGRFTVS